MIINFYGLNCELLIFDIFLLKYTQRFSYTAHYRIDLFIRELFIAMETPFDLTAQRSWMMFPHTIQLKHGVA